MCLLDRETVAEKDLLYGKLMDGFGLFPSFLYKQLDTAHALFSYHIFLTNLFVN